MKYKVFVRAENTAGYDVVTVEAKNVGVSNGVLYLMSDTGNVAVFAREEWLRAVRWGA